MALVSWIKKILLTLLLLVLALLAFLLLFERLQRVMADRNYPRPGELFDVGGHKLHALIRGSGAPSVIFESGLGIDGHLSWYKIQDPVAEFTKTLSYDRAGVLWSERGTNPKTAESISDELARLLDSASIEPPYILVGHSLAGNALRPFIAKHGADIAGIVYVDVSHPEQYQRFPEELGERSNAGPPAILMQLMRSFGVLRYLLTTGQIPTDDPDDIYATVVPSMVHRGIGVRHESANAEAIADGAAAITDFGDIPLIVITGASPQRNQNAPFSQAVRDEMTASLNTMQQELLRLSTNSRQVLAQKSEHYVQISEPDIVIDAIRSLITAARE